MADTFKIEPDAINQDSIGHAAISSVLQLRQLTPDLADALICFFDEISGDPYFHPHPFTMDQARKLCEYQGQDIYLAAIEGPKILGYGMLRGWDAGYTTPALGIAISPTARGRGLGELFMRYMHYVAETRGASNIRLRVHPENSAAISMYRKLGYVFLEEFEGNQQVGMLSL